MKKQLTIQQAKSLVESLVGKNVSVRLNKGRNKIVNCKATVKKAYENVFEMEVPMEITGKLTCSYADVVCKEIVFKNSE
jgi:uncharacterized protein Veg